ncbi:hypothetical protein NKG05_12230 [Oerskovia sp. M15]
MTTPSSATSSTASSPRRPCVRSWRSSTHAWSTRDASSRAGRPWSRPAGRRAGGRAVA